MISAIFFILKIHYLSLLQTVLDRLSDLCQFRIQEIAVRNSNTKWRNGAGIDTLLKMKLLGHIVLIINYKMSSYYSQFSVIIIKFTSEKSVHQKKLYQVFSVPLHLHTYNNYVKSKPRWKVNTVND